MYKSLYYKIVFIFAIFMVTVMLVVGTILLMGVSRFYTDDFVAQMDRHLGESSRLRVDLIDAFSDDDFILAQKNVLNAYSTSLGIDDYRSFNILDIDGNLLEGSADTSGIIRKTDNLLSAMNGTDGTDVSIAADFTDYAVYLSSDSGECIIYIYDSQEELEALRWELFVIILQSMLIGLIIAVVLSFVLSKAITSPIQSLTYGASQLAEGEFSQKIEAYSNDEIGTLTDTFNNMREVLKNTLDEVSGEREKLETVFSYLQDAVVAFSIDGRILHINKSAIELLGSNYNPNLKCGRFMKLLNIEYSRSYIKQGDGSTSQIILRDVEFRDKALDVSIGPLKYIEDNIPREGIITVIHDVTARYELDKAQREFVANVSHELRTPLTSIKGASETLLSYPDMSNEMKENFLHMSIDECNRMLRIVMDLLTLSRLDNNKTKWKITEFDMKQSLIRICKVMQIEAESHGHSLTLTVDGELPKMTGDAERIEQVIINIVSNAVKYTPDGGIIEINATYSLSNVMVIITDNGIGIPKEDLPRLFERFYRVEKARTSESGGTGLGLAIAKEIITSHGGEIRIDSDVGKGTKVTITLPIRTKLKGEEA